MSWDLLGDCRSRLGGFLYRRMLPTTSHNGRFSSWNVTYTFALTPTFLTVVYALTAAGAASIVSRRASTATRASGQSVKGNPMARARVLADAPMWVRRLICPAHSTKKTPQRRLSVDLLESRDLLALTTFDIVGDVSFVDVSGTVGVVTPFGVLRFPIQEQSPGSLRMELEGTLVADITRNGTAQLTFSGGSNLDGILHPAVIDPQDSFDPPHAGPGEGEDNVGGFVSALGSYVPAAIRDLELTISSGTVRAGGSAADIEFTVTSGRGALEYDGEVFREDMTGLSGMNSATGNVVLTSSSVAETLTIPLGFSVSLSDNDLTLDLNVNGSVTGTRSLEADLVGESLSLSSTHLLGGMTTVDFTIENAGTGDATNFAVDILLSDDEVIGNGDDLVIDSVNVAGVAAGGTTHVTRDLELPRDVLNALAERDDPPAQQPYISSTFEFIGIRLDPLNEVAESDELNNVNQGTDVDKAWAYYFPWDIDSDGVVLPADAIFVINRLGSNVPPEDARADFDGDSQVLPSDAIAAINRLGYRHGGAPGQDASIEPDKTGQIGSAEKLLSPVSSSGPTERGKAGTAPLISENVEDYDDALNKVVEELAATTGHTDQGRRFQQRIAALQLDRPPPRQRTLRPASLRYDATTWNTASLKPPMFRMSSRSGACVEPYGWMSMQTSFGELTPIRCWFATNVCHSDSTPVAP